MVIWRYLSCSRKVRKKNKTRAKRTREKNWEVFRRLALTKEGEGSWKPWLCTRRCERERFWLEENQRFEIAAEHCGVFSWEAKACPWNVSAQRECKHFPGPCLWAVCFGLCGSFLTLWGGIATALLGCWDHWEMPTNSAWSVFLFFFLFLSPPPTPFRPHRLSNTKFSFCMWLLLHDKAWWTT